MKKEFLSRALEIVLVLTKQVGLGIQEQRIWVEDKMNDVWMELRTLSYERNLCVSAFCALFCSDHFRLTGTLCLN